MMPDVGVEGLTRSKGFVVCFLGASEVGVK